MYYLLTWLPALAALVGGILVGQLYRLVIQPALCRLLQAKQLALPAALVKATAKPMAFLCVLLGLVAAADLAPLPALLLGLPLFLHRVFRLAVIWSIGWCLAGDKEPVELLLNTACKKLDAEAARSVTGFLSSVLRIVVWAFVLVIMIGELGYDVNGMIAGVGLGGLTVALAAQDTAANFFAGLVLVFERPISVGDFISYGEFNGTVESIGFRTTQLRTMEDKVITVPNSSLCSAPLTDWSRMRKRLISFVLGLRYDTPAETLQQVTARIADMIKGVDGVQSDTVCVYFSGFGDSALNIQVRYCIADTAFAAMMEVTQQVNTSIMHIVADAGTDFAFPSQSIYLENK